MAKFYMVKCKCGNEQKVFSHASQKVSCRACHEVLAQPSGGEAVILGEKTREME